MNVYEFTMPLPDGSSKPLSDYEGQVLLIVNTASKCGFTPQYEGLEALHRAYQDKGFEVLGFPCNQFGAQEPGRAAEIAAFCATSFDVTFPLFDKVEVNGPNRHPLYAWLTKQKRGFLGSQSIKWNFTKFLIGKDGQLVKRFAPATKPQDLTREIEALLK